MRDITERVDTMVLRPRQLDPTEAIRRMKTIECGEDAKKHFLFDAGYTNLNHGSFGASPSPIREVLRFFQDQAESRPDVFIRYTYPPLLDKSRAAVADLLHAPVSTCVFVQNATTGFNTVLRNLVFEKGDVIIYFSTIYGACEKTIIYITETTNAEARKVEYTYPVSDGLLCAKFTELVKKIKSEGRLPKIAVFDTVASMPGVRMPFEQLTRLCREHGVLSLIDGAHGIGQIPLNLGELDPDFFVSNCHKWLLAPRGCAVFYVPERNQHLMRSTLPTSHGFIPREGQTATNPLPLSANSPFVADFEFVGTLDNSSYCCVPATIEWRSKLTYNGKSGEEAIMAYTHTQARESGRHIATVLGTEVMENEEGTLGHCNLSNVRLPLKYAKVADSDYGQAVKVAIWITETLVKEYDTFIAIMFYADAWWVRLSSQVYLTMEDFEWAAAVLKELCIRVEQGEWRN